MSNIQIIILLTVISLQNALSKELPLRSANVLFLIDQSNSIWHYNFLREKRFVQETVQRFELGSRYTRVAVATYGSSLHVRIKFKNYKNLRGLTRLIDGIQRSDNPNTNLGPGLMAFHQIFKNDKEYCRNNYDPIKGRFMKFKKLKKRNSLMSEDGDVERMKKDLMYYNDENIAKVPLNVVVVLGDGDYKDDKQVLDLIHCLRSENISIFAVGVGRNIETKKLDRIVPFPPSLYRINVTHLDARVLATDSMSESKPGKIWEFMVKHKAMSEECLPHRKRIQLNFLLDIMSRNSWRYPIILKIAQDIYIRMIKKYKPINHDGNFVKIRFFPKSYGFKDTIHALDPSTWEEDDQKRYEALLKDTHDIKLLKKVNGSYIQEIDSGHDRNAWERLSRITAKVIKNVMMEDIPSIQQVIIYVTDRNIKMTVPYNIMQRTKKLLKINKKVALKRKFELFGIALGGFFKISQMEALLRTYHINPHSRLYAFQNPGKKYLKYANYMLDLFCGPSNQKLAL